MHSVSVFTYIFYVNYIYVPTNIVNLWLLLEYKHFTLNTECSVETMWLVYLGYSGYFTNTQGPYYAGSYYLLV